MKPEIFRLSATFRWLTTITLGAMAGIMLALLLGLLQNKDGVPVEWSVRIGLPVLIGLPCLFAIFWVWWERILTDADGLRWRRVWRDNSARWEEIDDYFITLNSHGSQASRISVVKFFDGRVFKFSGDFSEWSRLQKVISERAVNAKAKGWLMRGKEGNITGKIVAVYTEKQYRSNIKAILFILGLFSAMAIAIPFLPDKNGARDNSWWPTIIFLAIFFTLAILGISAFRRTRKHIGERIEADEKGFVAFSPNGQKRHVLWNEVATISTFSSFSMKDSHQIGWTLETKEGPVTFLAEMENSTSLFSLTRQCVPQAFAVTKPSSVRDTLVSTEKTNGRRVFHYRTRSNRDSLGGLLSFSFLFLGIAAYCWWLNTHQTVEEASFPLRYPDVLLTCFGGIFAAGWVYGLWRYKSARLILDGEGITQHGLRGVVRVGYEEISRLGAFNGFYVETHDGRRPVRWTGNVADAHELRLELEKRTGLKFLSAEVVEQVEEPAKQPDDVEEKLERGHAGR